MEKPTPERLGIPWKNAFCDQAFDIGSYCQRSERQESPGLMYPPTRYPVSPITQPLAPVLSRPVNSALLSQLPPGPSVQHISGVLKQEYNIKTRLVPKINFVGSFSFIAVVFLNLFRIKKIETLNRVSRIYSKSPNR